jgi:hypothetical protein
VEFHALPDLKALGSDAPLVIDFSSHVASRPVDWSRVGLAFGGAQKNLGPAGLTLVVVREDLLGHALPICPSAFDYKIVADNQSMYNTPPTWGIYMAGLTFQWLKRPGRHRRHGGAQHRQGKLLYRPLTARSCTSTRWQKLPLTHERALLPARRVDAATTPSWRRQGTRSAAAQGPQVGGRHARQHLQRHAAGRACRRWCLHARFEQKHA